MVIDSDTRGVHGLAMTEANVVLASVSEIPVRVIKILPSGYQIPHPLPWPAICRADVAFRYRFQFATLSGKSAHAFPLAVSAGLQQRFDPPDISTPVLGIFGKTFMSDPRLSKPATRCPP
ncbi:hypothetical protein [Bradyrhizobium sp.]|uniref:hypothetical protein n=1 Tax=Bradyrhizobium sp. TaxID=376 RepID=UPI0025BA7B6F|nr:hypothetical protein [Bradyrhizobium sp.]